MMVTVVNSVAVSIVDVYKSPPTTTLQNYEERKPDPSRTTPYTAEPPCKRVMLENGDVERTVAAPPRKRIRRSSSSSPQDRVELKVEDGVSANADPICAASVLTSATATTPSLRLTQALPLSGRIIGTVWQPVHSQSTTAAVSTSSGIFLCFLFFSLWPSPPTVGSEDSMFSPVFQPSLGLSVCSSSVCYHLFNGWISMKRCANIHHVHGHCQKGFQGFRSKVKVIYVRICAVSYTHLTLPTKRIV